MLPGLDFPNVTDHSISDIWYESEGFNRYRGKAWMKEPCRSCPEADDDLGGCRCQAFMLANDPAVADPVCDKSPHRHVVDEAIELAQKPDSERVIEQTLIFRDPKESKRLTEQDSVSRSS
jgi:pyrroloquinoline quinone biosynthesis protein E